MVIPGRPWTHSGGEGCSIGFRLHCAQLAGLKHGKTARVGRVLK